MAIRFASASAQYLYVNSDPLAGTGAFPSTLCGFVRQTTNGGAQHLISRCSQSSDTHYHRIYNSSGTLGSGVRAGSGEGNLNGGSIGVGVWRHFALTIDAGKYLRLYVGGTLTGGPTLTSAANPTINKLSLAVLARPSMTGFLNGDLAEIALYRTALSAADLLLLAGGDPPDTVQAASLGAYWPLSDNSDLSDSVAGLTLTAVNGPSSTDHPTMNPPGGGSSIVPIAIHSYRLRRA